MALTDTHCHLDMYKFDHDRPAVVERAAQAGLVRILIPGLDPASSLKAIQLAESRDMLFAAVGFHPSEMDQLSEAGMQTLNRRAVHPKVAAIGEIGLDYYWVKDPQKRAEQRAGLKQQLSLAQHLQKPVVLHSREEQDREQGACAEDLLDILEEWVSDLSRSASNEKNGSMTSSRLIEHPGVLHSFSGSPEIARRAIELGFFIGVTGPVTYKKADRRREIIASLPLESLLIETDAPYLAPEPVRGKRNEPAFVAHIADKIAEIQSRSPQEIAARTTANAARLFSWGESV